MVDVRSPEEFKQGHVKRAINIHVNEVYKKRL
ncbi:rhodanese-like domain-containing protein [Flexistipes sinusarabici]